MKQDDLNPALTKPAAKKSATKKPAAKKTSQTEVIARDEAAHENVARPERVRMSSGGKLTVPTGIVDTEVYYTRWIADRPGRVAQALAAEYSHVVVDGVNYMRDGEVKMYLMKLLWAHRHADNKLKRKETSAKMAAEQELGEGEYIPEGKKHSLEKETDLDPLA